MTSLLAAEHVGALAVIAACAVAAVSSARRWPGLWVPIGCRALAVVLVAAELGWWTYLLSRGLRGFNIYDALPLQLCDMTAFVAAFALWFRKPTLVELTYFWGLAGSTQALLTPDLPHHFPTFLFFQYYVAHGGIVVAALVLAVGLRQAPRRSAVVTVALITIADAALVGAIDALSGSNYMYLRFKPPSPTPLDVLGPWPWYLLPATLIGLILFLVLDLPFRLRRDQPRPVLKRG